MSKTTLFLVMIACLAAAIALPCFGAQISDIAVPVNVTYTKTPPSITLHWTATDTLSSTLPYIIYRRNNVGDPWLQVATPAMTDRSWTDTNVAVGTHYEYQLTCQYTDWNVLSNAYIYAGIEMPVVDNRGKLVLIVDSAKSTALQSELTRFVQDLIGDGWQVIRHDVAATSLTPAQVKSTILADYQADPTNVKQVLLFGHFPVFYSAPLNPDGHGARPWPADAFYADMDGAWPANSVTGMPSPAELQLGRVDMANMPSFGPLTETDLLRRYLNKDHNYRTKQFLPMMKAMWCPNFGWGGGSVYPFPTGGLRSWRAILGDANLVQDQWTNVYSAPYLLAEGDGSGTDTSAQGVIATYQLPTYDPAVFTMLGGSHFGQWDYSDNLMRAVTATPNYGLTCSYCLRVEPTMHHMALGETVGFSTQTTINNFTGNYTPTEGEFSGGVCACWYALMGDPSLRLFMVGMPGALTATSGDIGDVSLSWGASADSVLGYYVYRSTQAGGPFTRITPNLVTATTYHDSNPPAGNEYYMVKAVVLQTTPSGSYYNPSQGVFANCTVPLVQIPTSGMAMWLKNNVGVTKNAANLVSSWSDISGNSNAVTQLTSALQPLYVSNDVNSQQAVRFQGGSGQVLQSAGLPITGSSQFTIIAYAKLSSSTSPQTLFWQGDDSSAGGYGFYLASSGVLSAGWRTSAGEIVSSSPTPAGKWYLVETTYDASTHKLWINGNPDGSSAKSDSNFSGGVFSLGNYGPAPSQAFSGDIAEVMMYNRVLSDTERTSIESYLKGKYGKPVPSFVSTPPGGLVPVSATFDASASSDPDGSIVSYSWDFGDGAKATGVTANHTYAVAGTYTVTLTLTDNDGQTSSVTSMETVMPALSAVSLAASPIAPVSPGTTVTLTATPTGGYTVLYKFKINDGTGWKTLVDYQSSSTCTWTPSANGTYQIQVYAKSASSPNSYDAVSPAANYIVATIPNSGLAMWLRADSGVTASGGVVSSWQDQSAADNTLSQSNPSYQPTLVSGVVNGLPVVRFVGGSCALQSTASILTGSNPFTVFAVFRMNSQPGTNYQYVWWNGTDSATAGYGVYISSTNRLRQAWGGNTSFVTLTGSASTGTWYRTCSRYTSGSQDSWLNGTVTGSNAPTGSSLGAGFAVGNYASGQNAYQGLYGDVAEILVYNRKLTDTELQSVDSYLAGRWWPAPPVLEARITDVRALSDGANVSITSPKVATVASGTFSDGSCYLEEPDRSSAIKVTGATFSLWDNVNVTGTLSTDANGERVLTVSSVDSRTSGTAIGPLGMAGKSLSASGLLARVWGKVTSSGTSSFVLDDGSGSPVTVDVSGLVSSVGSLPGVGTYAGVTGPAGYTTGSALVVKPRSAADIQTY